MKQHRLKPWLQIAERSKSLPAVEQAFRKGGFHPDVRKACGKNAVLWKPPLAGAWIRRHQASGECGRLQEY